MSLIMLFALTTQVFANTEVKERKQTSAFLNKD